MNESTATNAGAKRAEHKKTEKRLHRDPNKAMQEMMVTINQLRGTLAEETNALKDADTPSFLALQEKKLGIAQDYISGMSQLLDRQDELKKADSALKQKMESMREEFSETVYENHAALGRMKNGMKRLGERIMEKTREAAKKEEELIYGSTGRMYSGIRASVGVSETA